MKRVLLLAVAALCLAGCKPTPHTAVPPPPVVTSQGAALPATPGDVWTVATNAKPGDTVQLTGGEYVLELWNMPKTGEVVIEPAPGAKVTVLEINANGSTYLTFRNLHVVQGAAYQYAVQVWSANHITLDGLTVEGPSCDTLSGAGASFRDLKANSAVVLKRSTMRCLGSGIGMTDVDGVTVDGLTLDTIATDGIIMGGVANTLITNVQGKNFRPNEGDHPDFIQWFNGTYLTTNNLHIVHNRFDRGTGGLVQGIFGEDGEYIYIEDNAIFGPMYNGVGLARSKHFTIKRNYVQPLTTEGDLGSWIIVRQEADDGDVSDNGTPAMTIGVSNEPQPTNIRVSKTTITYAADPGDNTQFDAWKAATSGHPIPEPPACACAAPLVGRVIGLRSEVANLQRQLDASQRRADAAVRVLQPAQPTPR